MIDRPISETTTPHAHPVDSFIGKRLWLRRKLLGMSQGTLAKGVGVTFQQVQKYERGVNRISVSRLYDFAKALEVPIAYFFEGLEATNDNYEVAEGNTIIAAQPRAVFETDAILTPDALEMLRLYHGLSPSVRKKVTEMVKALAGDSIIIAAPDTKN